MYGCIQLHHSNIPCMRVVNPAERKTNEQTHTHSSKEAIPVQIIPSGNCLFNFIVTKGATPHLSRDKQKALCYKFMRLLAICMLRKEQRSRIAC